MSRFFVDTDAISSDKIILTDDNMHHLVNVLRHRVGDEVTVSDSSGFDYICSIVEINKDSVILKITDKTKNASEPLVKISLFQGVPKGDKLSLIVEKCVEAGVFEITPVDMARCVSKLSKKDFAKKKERLDKISLSASKQSGRGIVPNVNHLISFNEFLDLKDEFDLVIFPYEDEKNTSLKEVIKNFKGEKIAVIIGPEGGFSKEEAEKIIANNISSVTLGNRILRTETAGMATIFNILYELEL